MDKYPFFARATLRVLRKKNKKRNITGKPPNEPCVFLCRHRDANGVIWAFTDIDRAIRPWVLNCFCEYKDARFQLKNYTFSKRLKKGKLFCFFFAPICARIIVSYVNGVQGIPVYRNENAGRSISTIKQTVKALEEGDSVLIFVDKDYENTEEQNYGDIYKGFYAVDKLYEKRNGKHIPFVPIYANKDGSKIHEPIYFENAKSEEFYEKIIYGIYNP